jgi:hypothetical protein
MASLSQQYTETGSFSGDPALLQKLQEAMNRQYQTAQAYQAQPLVEEQYTEFEEIEITDFRKKAIDEKLGHLKKL